MRVDTLAQALDIPISRAQLWAGPITSAMDQFGIDTPARQAAFVAQIGHESGQLKFVRELWGPTLAQQKYEGRADLGNTQRGDGYTYRGRGLIQITGRSNYAQVGRALGVDFVSDPAKLEVPTWAALSAGWYWQTRGLNDFADPETPQSFTALTQRINGGINGLDDRKRLWLMARRALGLSTAV